MRRYVTPGKVDPGGSAGGTVQQPCRGLNDLNQLLQDLPG